MFTDITVFIDAVNSSTYWYRFNENSLFVQRTFRLFSLNLYQSFPAHNYSVNTVLRQSKNKATTKPLVCNTSSGFYVLASQSIRTYQEGIFMFLRSSGILYLND